MHTDKHSRITVTAGNPNTWPQWVFCMCIRVYTYILWSVGKETPGLRISVIISSVRRGSVCTVIGQPFFFFRTPQGEKLRFLAGGWLPGCCGHRCNSYLMNKVTYRIRHSLYSKLDLCLLVSCRTVKSTNKMWLWMNCWIFTMPVTLFCLEIYNGNN